ncbi:MAG TPA: hypothetical protein VG452_07635 [Egibacteraceae bacterium]|nr:hypothetical protein [Egibacteraceae bacterium]
MHVRAIDAALADLPADARRALQRFAPDGCALVVTSLFSQLEAVAGRRVLGARPEAWRRLEDKTDGGPTGRGSPARDGGLPGVFTVDGVMTAEGFRPTELNPRFGAAIALMARATGLPLYLLHLASVHRPDLDWRQPSWRRASWRPADAHPVAAGSIVLS